MFKSRRLLQIFTLLGLALGLNACGDSSSQQGSKLEIVGGRPVSAGEKSPALGLLMRYKDPVGALYLTKTCSGVRVSSTQILTAASCLSDAEQGAVQLTFVVAGDGTRASSPVITKILPHPSYEPSDGDTSAYNLALIRLESFPAALDSKVTVAALPQKNVAVQDAVKVYGAGCEKLQVSEKCDGAYTILRYLKTFDTVVDKFEADTFDEKFFTTLNVEGQSVDGDQGGPALNALAQVVGIASYRKSVDPSDPDGKHSVYLNLTDADIKQFLNSSISEQAPPVKVNFQTSLVEGETGSFLATGSFATIEVSASLLAYQLHFSLNGSTVNDADQVRNGTRITLRRPLKEGANTLNFTASNDDDENVFEDTFDIYAGSRTLRFIVPELTNTAELNMRADLLTKEGINARGRGWFEGNDLIFKNVPPLAVTARIDFPGQALSYTEFMTETSKGATLVGGRMLALSTNENLDWSNGLAGWVVTNPSYVRVVLGKTLNEGSTAAVAVAATRPLRPASVKSSLASAVLATNPLISLSDTPFIVQNTKRYLVLAPAVGQMAAVTKTFKPNDKKKALHLTFSLRVKGYSEASVSARSVGQVSVEVRNAKGDVSEYTNIMEGSTIVSGANGLFFDRVDHWFDTEGSPVEVKIKMTNFDLAFGTPELIVSQLEEKESAASVLELDDGVDITDVTVDGKIYPLEMKPLEFLSLGTCGGSCVYDTKLNGYHALWGKMAFKLEPGTKIEDMKLIFHDGTRELGTGEVYDPTVKAQLFKEVGADGILSINTRMPLFRYSQTIIPRTSSAGTRVQLILLVNTSKGGFSVPYNKKTRPLTWYQNTNAGTTGADKVVGGDRWGRVDNFASLSKFSTFIVNDIANVHGGNFPPHKTHKTGRSVDLTDRATYQNTGATVDDVLAILNSDEATLASTKLVYMTLQFSPLGANATAEQRATRANRQAYVDKVVKRLQDLVDEKLPDGRFISPYTKENGIIKMDYERQQLSVFKHRAGHWHHIHVEFIP